MGNPAVSFLQIVRILALVAALAACSSNGNGRGDTAGELSFAFDADGTAGSDLTPADGEGRELGRKDSAADMDSPPVFQLCTGNEDCAEGICTQHLGEGICSPPCVPACPQGFSCKEISGVSPGISFACVSDWPTMCRPCSNRDDCRAGGGADRQCVEYPGNGWFCSVACGSDSGCPKGFVCAQTSDLDGNQKGYCLAANRQCPCTETSVANQYFSLCENSAPDGSTCRGKKVCTAEGLSDCDAKTPTAETCDGLDQDCDGQVDEGSCDDGNDCTTDRCNPSAGCEYEPIGGKSCDDGDLCTVTDHCSGGECVGTPIECRDSNPCTDDLCDGVSGCRFEFNTIACDDKDPCTGFDHCLLGLCKGEQVPCECEEDADCAKLEDGNRCNGVPSCDKSGTGRRCVIMEDSIVTCPAYQGENRDCLQNVCDPQTGECTVTAFRDGLDCDDGDHCTIGEACTAGVCGGGEDVFCDDSNPCTDDSCDPAKGCVNAPNSAPCDDSNSCTAGDTCSAGKCQPGTGTPDCDDRNDCTMDQCVTGYGCFHSNLSDKPCNEKDPCTGAGICQAGKCSVGPSCEDYNPCTDNYCHPVTGCLFTPNTLACNDLDPCTANDRCAGGVCAGTVSVCDDGNPCTDDACDPQTGVCKYTVDDSNPCTDQNACTKPDACVHGVCVPGPDTCPCATAKDCAAKEDGDLCNGTLYCNTSKTPPTCELNPGSIVTCKPDGDTFCTHNICLPAVGLCYQTPRNEGENCDKPCTIEPTCQNGTCKGLDCSVAGLACASGVCISRKCTPNTRICDGNTNYMSCNSAGTDWSASTFCGAGKFCEAGNCKTQICVPGTVMCLGTLAGTCNSAGSGLAEGYTDCQVLPATPTCLAGKCVSCTSNCTGKTCGSDGCGGSCGVCGEGKVCGPVGTCIPDIVALGAKWISIPGGSYAMGCSVNDTQCQSNEKPAHQVTIKAFEILESEVTEGQYQAVVGTNPSNSKLGDSYPVETVTWSQAKAFCQTVGGKLPTEAQWEYAVRAGTTTKYYCGDDSTCLDSVAWYMANAASSKHLVKGKMPNVFGLYDMLGNVWEWTEDYYHSSYTGAPADGSAWLVPTASTRIVRGGGFSWYGNASYLRSSSRYNVSESGSPFARAIGFRCVR